MPRYVSRRRRCNAGRVVAALMFAAALWAGVSSGAAPAFAQQAKKGDKPASPVPANIDRNGVIILVRGALLALDQANKTGNYTVLRDLGSPGFQANSAADLARVFADHREKRLDLGGLAVLEPQLSLLPQIEPDGMLRMAGFFPSVPSQVNFDLMFAPVDRTWRLFGISVRLTDGGPQAPETPAMEETSQKAEPPDPPTTAVEIRPKQEPGNWRLHRLTGSPLWTTEGPVDRADKQA